MAAKKREGCINIHDCIVCTELAGTVKAQCGKIKLLNWMVAFFILGSITSGTVAAVAKSDSKAAKRKMENVVTKDLFQEFKKNQDERHNDVMYMLKEIKKEL